MKLIFYIVNTPEKRFVLISFVIALFFLITTQFVYAEGGGADSGLGDQVADGIALLIHNIALGIGGMFVGLGGLLLDMVVSETILNSGAWLRPGLDGGLGNVIAQVWTIIRDILNILFIFAFIYIGIKTILDSHSSETRRSLGMLILAALLINFSLFFTQVIVDFSNIAAIQIHNQISAGVAGGYSDENLVLESGTIAGGFMNVAKLSSFFQFDGELLKEMDFWKTMTYSLMMMIFLIIAGIIFMMGAFLLIRRFITLILCMMFSPLMFAGWILPQFSGQQEQWRGKLLMNAFFAPAFFLMVYISLAVLDALKQTIFEGQVGGFPELMNGNAMEVGHFSIVFFFTLAIGFLYASIKVGEMMSIAGAQSAMKITKKAIGGATVGLGARIARNTAGRGFDKWANNEKFKDLAARNVIARGALRGVTIAADSNMDLRSAGFGGDYMGTARKGGYKTTTEEVKKREEETAKLLGDISDEDPIVAHMKHQEHHIEEEIDALKLKKEAAEGDEAKAAVQKEIKKKEKELKDKKEEIIQEKNRRITGSASQVKAHKAVEKALSEAENQKFELNEQLQAAIQRGDTVTATVKAEQIKTVNNDIARYKKQSKEMIKTLGYAGKLETSNILQSWSFNRFAAQDHKAGAALRKKYTKESMKADAHKHSEGGGRDDHGGGDDHGAPPAGGGHGGGGHH